MGIDSRLTNKPMILPHIFIDKTQNNKTFIVNSFDRGKAILFEEHNEALTSEVLLSELAEKFEYKERNYTCFNPFEQLIECEDRHNGFFIHTEPLPEEFDNLFFELLQKVAVAMFKIGKRGYSEIIEGLEAYFEHDYGGSSSFLAVVLKVKHDLFSICTPFLDNVDHNSISSETINRYWVKGQKAEYYVFIGH